MTQPIEGAHEYLTQRTRTFYSLHRLYHFAEAFKIDHALIEKGVDAEGTTVYAISYNNLQEG